MTKPAKKTTKQKNIDDVHGAAAVKEFALAAKAWGIEATKSKEAAREILRELGIITPTGLLKKNYRTPTKLKHFDLEQDILNCWHIVDDIDQLLEMIIDRDAPKDKVKNVLTGLSVLYGDRFQKLMNTFEEILNNKEVE